MRSKLKGCSGKFWFISSMTTMSVSSSTETPLSMLNFVSILSSCMDLVNSSLIGLISSAALSTSLLKFRILKAGNRVNLFKVAIDLSQSNCFCSCLITNGSSINFSTNPSTYFLGIFKSGLQSINSLHISRYSVNENSLNR